jgi:hypothetical protein
MKPLIVYHGNCLDGSSAALCAFMKFGNQAEYYPAIYGAKFTPETKNREVYFAFTSSLNTKANKSNYLPTLKI